MKVSELSGATLDRAVNQIEEHCDDPWTPLFSTNWSLAGPIIERERIAVKENGYGWWFARVGGGFGQGKWVRGDTPLIAAMRCFVASKLGDEIEVPKEITGE